MTPKELKKLAASCRKAGIKHYRCADFEFTLTDDMPITPTRHKSMLKISSSPMTTDKVIESDQEFTEEQMLFWSSNDGAQ